MVYHWQDFLSDSVNTSKLSHEDVTKYFAEMGESYKLRSTLGQTKFSH